MDNREKESSKETEMDTTVKASSKLTEMDTTQKESSKETVQPELVSESPSDKAGTEVTEDPSAERSPKGCLDPEFSKGTSAAMEASGPSRGTEGKCQEETSDSDAWTSATTSETDEEIMDPAKLKALGLKILNEVSEGMERITVSLRKEMENFPPMKPRTRRKRFFEDINKRMTMERERKFLGDGAKGRLEVTATDHTSKKRQPRITLDDTTFRISLDVSLFDTEYLNVCVLDDSLDVYAAQRRDCEYGSEFFEIRKTFRIPRQLINAPFRAYIVDGILFIEASVPASGSIEAL